MIVFCFFETVYVAVIFFLSHFCLFLSREAVAVSKPTCPVVDVGVVRYTTNEILPQKVQAKPEETEVAQKLIPSLSDAEIEEVRMAMRSAIFD